MAAGLKLLSWLQVSSAGRWMMISGDPHKQQL